MSISRWSLNFKQPICNFHVYGLFFPLADIFVFLLFPTLWLNFQPLLCISLLALLFLPPSLSCNSSKANVLRENFRAVGKTLLDNAVSKTPFVFTCLLLTCFTFSLQEPKKNMSLRCSWFMAMICRNVHYTLKAFILVTAPLYKYFCVSSPNNFVIFVSFPLWIQVRL